MCCSASEAKFSDTTLYAGEALRGKMLVHVMGYQNTAQHLGGHEPPAGGGLTGSSFSWKTIGGAATPEVRAVGNAMILPIPSAAPMGPENVIDTSKCPQILKNIKDALPRTRSMAMGTRGMAKDAVSFGVQVFDTGIYTVVLISPGADPAAVRRALEESVPAEKRPSIKDELITTYLKKWYAGWHLAICCFNNMQAIKADPLLWWYEPLFPNALFLPALDAHDGGLPKLDEDVEVDHAVAFGSYRMEKGDGHAVRYEGEIPAAVRALLPDQIVGREMRGLMANGDFVCLVDDVRAGGSNIQRLPPPGA